MTDAYTLAIAALLGWAAGTFGVVLGLVLGAILTLCSLSWWTRNERANEALAAALDPVTKGFDP